MNSHHKFSLTFFSHVQWKQYGTEWDDLNLEKYISGYQTEILIENLDPDIYYDVSISAIYPGGIQSSPSTGKTATNGEQCTCRSYLIRQRTLERTIIGLAKTIQYLSDKIESLSVMTRSYTIGKKKSVDEFDAKSDGFGEVKSKRPKRQMFKFTPVSDNPFEKYYS